MNLTWPPAAEADAAVASRRVHVPLGDRSYDVHIGAGVRRLLPRVVAEIGARRVAIVSARPAGLVPDPGVPADIVDIEDGERTKSLATVERLCHRFAEFGLTRQDAVIACGGGTTTDTAGLAAALYHRGVAVVHLPTTLLAQVDASVGGKTAVNLTLGKNMIGAFWQPRAVLCDTELLATLPAREWANGYGEIARAHFIGAGDLRRASLTDQIAGSVARKAEIVAADELDTGLRHLLNYGHTLGHALELATGYALRHGEAVGIGTVFAGLLARELGRIDDARAREHADVVAGYGVPTGLPRGLSPDLLIGQMRRDKKALSGLGFVLDGPGGAELVADVPEAAVRRALAAMEVNETWDWQRDQP